MKIEKEKLVKNKKRKDLLNITYVMNWAGVCGGTKIILEQANNLSRRGHKVSIVCKDDKPAWFPIEKGIKYIKVTEGKTYGELVPKNSDVIICSGIHDVIEKKIAPVILFEQGDGHLFDRKNVDEERLKRKDIDYSQCNHIMTVSEFARKKIKKYYKKDSFIIPNAVDNSKFYYEKHKKKDAVSIVAIGRDDWEFKGVKYIVNAVKRLSKKYNIVFNWITQVEPQKPFGNVYVNPQQIVIGNVLRDSDIYVCASKFESFCLPVLEAMSCGAAVVTTDNGGNREFARDGETCLIVKKKSTKDIAEKIEKLILDKELKNTLVKNALKTAKDYNWTKIIDNLEEYLRDVAMYSVL